jgi:hypothetical protein
MVRGLEKFREFFRNYNGSYVIIGGTACDIAINEAGLTPRATKDIDIILIVEAISPAFVSKFWEFVKVGGYEIKEIGDRERKYYRFTKPSNSEYPYQIEIFSKKPDLLDLKEGAYLTPIPVSAEIPSLSAILLDEDYYKYTIDHSSFNDALRIANPESLICLKAKAYLEISERIANGSKEDPTQLRKHKTDVFRLAVTLTEADIFELPDRIKEHLQTFADTIAKDLPDKAIFKEMGLGSIDVEKVFHQLIKNFNLITNS